MKTLKERRYTTEIGMTFNDDYAHNKLERRQFIEKFIALCCLAA